jgi:hypothetical protein
MLLLYTHIRLIAERARALTRKRGRRRRRNIKHKSKCKVNRNRPWRPIGLRDITDLILLDNGLTGGGKALRTGSAPLPTNIIFCFCYG